MECYLCNSVVDLTGIGTPGATGAAGADGTSGVSILDSSQTEQSTATTGSWVNKFSKTIAINTLPANGDFIEVQLFTKGFASGISSISAVRVGINGTALINTDTSYITSANETFHIPYAVAAGMEVKVRIVRLSATTVTVLMYCYGTGTDATRMDIYSTSFAVNNLTSATNSITVDIYNTTASTMKINDYKIVLYKA